MSQNNSVYNTADSIRSTLTRWYDIYETGKAHTCQAYQSNKQCLSDTFDKNMVIFHKERHAHPWTIIGCTALAGGILGLPFGRGAFFRHFAFYGLLSTSLVNPEYLSDLYYNSIKPKL